MAHSAFTQEPTHIRQLFLLSGDTRKDEILLVYKTWADELTHHRPRSHLTQIPGSTTHGPLPIYLQHRMAYYQPSYSQPGYAGQPAPSGYPATSPGYTDQSAAPGYPVHYYQPIFSNGTPPPLPSRRPPPAQAGGGASSLPTTGQFEGVQFHIDHRDSNAMLYIQLEPGAEVKAKSGSMVAMDATVKIKGKLKFSVAKLLSGENVCAVHWRHWTSRMS